MAIKVYPVVHVGEKAQVVDQTSLALEEGAAGVYLIDHISSSPHHLFIAYEEARAANPDAFIGLNLLGFTSLDAFMQLEGVDLTVRPSGLWVDDAAPDYDLTEVARAANSSLRNILYLGGVAFKYTSGYTDSPREAAAAAERLGPFVDVVVTSGRGTGAAPSREKIEAMKSAIGDQELAIASGVTAENLPNYTAADQILVSTSIETSPGSGVFDIEELRRFIETAHDLA